MTRADADALRARLVELQTEAVAKLVGDLPVVDTSMLRLVADIRATIAVLDAPQQQQR